MFEYSISEPRLLGHANRTSFNWQIPSPEDVMTELLTKTSLRGESRQVARITPNRSGIGRFLDEAANLMRKSRFNEAIDTLERGLSVEPDNMAAWEQVAACNLELRQPKKAIEALDHILMIQPLAGRIWGDKAYLHLLLNEDIEGINALKESLKLRPRNARDWQLLGITLMLNEELEEASVAFERGLLLDPNSASTWYNYAVCHFLDDDYDAALEAVEYAFSIEPMLEESAEDWIDYVRSEVLASEEDIDEEEAEAG